MLTGHYSRRAFCAAAGAAAIAAPRAFGQAGAGEPFKLRYILASSMYGGMKLAKILTEVRKTGAEHIDIWSKSHGTQRQ